MFKSRIFLLALCCWLGAVTLPAQTNRFITVNGKRMHPTRLLVKAAGGYTTLGVAAAATGTGTRVKQSFNNLPGWVVLDEPGADTSADDATLANRLAQRMSELRNTGAFEYVEPDLIRMADRTPTDARFVDGTLWGLRNQGQSGGVAGVDIGATNAWDITIGSNTVIVAVIDSGIRYTHQDLNINMWRNPGEINGDNLDNDNDGYVDDIFGINAVFRNGDPFDDDGHGTHVAGTIGAAANNGAGSVHVGVTWAVQLMALKFLDAFGSGTLSDEIACIDFAIAKRARIINASYGSAGFSQAEFDAVTRARNAGILFVTSAGNSGINNDVFDHYPSNFQIDNIVAVAAVDRRGALASFSNFGQNTVHVGAPGVGIFSTYNFTDQSYITLDGTSMAAPHVAGVAALIRSAFTNATLAEVRARLLKGTKPLASLNGTTVSGGMVNARNALTVVGDGLLEISVTPAPNALLLRNTTIPFFVSVTDTLPINNATQVVATIPNVITNLDFLNNGVFPDQFAADEIYSANIFIPSNVVGQITMTLTVRAPGKATSVTTHNYTVVSAPGNDNFAGAFKIPNAGGVVTGTNTFSSTEFSEPLHGGVATMANSVWWTWSPAQGGNTLIDLSGSSFDTVVGVYTGNSLDTLTEVVSLNDLGTKKQGYTNFTAVAGNTYRIAVAGTSATEVGQIRMRVEIGGTPDDVPPTVQITTPASGAIVTNATLIVSGTASDTGGTGAGVEAVFVKLNGLLPVITATGSNNWTATVTLQEGLNTIEVLATDFAGNDSAVVSVTVTLRVFDPPNDQFFNAITLSGTSGSISNNTTKATKEFGEPLHAGINSSNSIWYSFVAPADGVLNLNTTNSTFDTILAVYTGTRVDALTALQANDDATNGVVYSAISQPVQSGLTYRIAVDGVPGPTATGPAFLNYSFVNLTVRTVTITNSPGGVTSMGSGSFQNGTALLITATPNAGYDFVSWEGQVQSLNNPLNLVVTQNLAFGATFLPHLVSDDFETGNLSKLNWSAAGSAGWTVQTTNATEFGPALGKSKIAKSGAIWNNETSALTLRITNRAATGSFSYRVVTEGGFDHLDFYVNNTNLASTAGRLLHASSDDSGWLNFTFNLPAGTNVLQWRYVKDQSASNSLDAAYIDNVDLPLTVAKDSTTPALFSFIRQTGTNVEFRVYGQTNQTYLIQVSPDLSNWQTVSTNVAVHGIIQINDPVTSDQTRFYRAISP